MRRKEPDFLDEVITERSARDPAFKALFKAAVRRRALLRALASERERTGVSQTAVAELMNTSQSAVARLERGEIDAKLSTVDRFAAAVGKKVEWRLVAHRAKRRTAARTKRAAAASKR